MFVPSLPRAPLAPQDRRPSPPTPSATIPLIAGCRPFQPDHRAGCSTARPCPSGLSAWQLPVHHCASSSVGDVLAPVLASPPPKHQGQYHQHHHSAGDENARSPLFHSPLKGSLPRQPSPNLEDDRKESLPLQPSPKQSRCKSPLERFDSPMKFDASYEVNDFVDSDGKLDPSYESLVNDFMDAVENNRHEAEDSEDDPAEREKMYREQTKRFAELAQTRYNKNKNNKVKYSLVVAIDGNIIFERTTYYVHVNFSVMAKNAPKKNDPKVLIFAELHHVGDRPNAMALTSFHLLDEKKQLPGCYNQSQNSFSDEDKDIHHCYACDSDIKHPDGSRYKAGHFIATSHYRND